MSGTGNSTLTRSPISVLIGPDVKSPIRQMKFCLTHAVKHIVTYVQLHVHEINSSKLSNDLNRRVAKKLLTVSGTYPVEVY